MRTFMLHWRPGGGDQIHARLLTQRGENWVVCGVMQLEPAEFEALKEICLLYGIEVMRDFKIPVAIVT